MNPWAGNQFENPLANRLRQISGLNQPEPLSLGGVLQGQLNQIRNSNFQSQAPAYTPPPSEPARMSWEQFIGQGHVPSGFSWLGVLPANPSAPGSPANFGEQLIDAYYRVNKGQ